MDPCSCGWWWRLQECSDVGLRERGDSVRHGDSSQMVHNQHIATALADGVSAGLVCGISLLGVWVPHTVAHDPWQCRFDAWKDDDESRCVIGNTHFVPAGLATREPRSNFDRNPFCGSAATANECTMWWPSLSSLASVWRSLACCGLRIAPSIEAKNILLVVGSRRLSCPKWYSTLRTPHRLDATLQGRTAIDPNLPFGSEKAVMQDDG